VDGNKKGNAYQGGRDFKSMYGHVRKMASVRKKVTFDNNPEVYFDTNLNLAFFSARRKGEFE